MANQFVGYSQDLDTALVRLGGPGRDSCRCPRVGSRVAENNIKLGPFRYISSRKQEHLSSCPLFAQGELGRGHVLALTLAPFVARTIELFFLISSSQRLTSFSLRCSPIVPRSASPAFALFQDAATVTKRLGLLYVDSRYPLVSSSDGGVGRPMAPDFDQLEHSFEHIPARLDALFKSGDAIPNEKDQFGNTLLFVCTTQ